MKYFLKFLILILLITGCNGKENPDKVQPQKTLSIFTIHSNIWNRSWKDSFSKYEEDNNCKIEFTSFENSHFLFEAIKLNPSPDVIFGIDNIVYAVEDIDSLFVPYSPVGFQKINRDLIFDKTNRLIPVAYGNLAFIFNQDEIEDPPYTFGIMQDGFYKNKLLFPDPRTSSLGKAFLLWSISTFGENGYSHFWRSIKENIHTITPSWDECYNMFLAEEAPIVLGYSTIPLYHILNDSTTNISSVIPSEGGYRIIEAAGIFHLTQNIDLSQKFIDFLLSPEFQNSLIENTMTIPSTIEDLPSILIDFPIMSNNYTHHLSTTNTRKNYNKWLRRWISLTID